MTPWVKRFSPVGLKSCLVDLTRLIAPSLQKFRAICDRHRPLGPSTCVWGGGGYFPLPVLLKGPPQPPAREVLKTEASEIAHKIQNTDVVMREIAEAYAHLPPITRDPQLVSEGRTAIPSYPNLWSTGTSDRRPIGRTDAPSAVASPRSGSAPGGGGAAVGRLGGQKQREEQRRFRGGSGVRQMPWVRRTGPRDDWGKERTSAPGRREWGLGPSSVSHSRTSPLPSGVGRLRPDGHGVQPHLLHPRPALPPGGRGRSSHQRNQEPEPFAIFTKPVSFL